MFKIESYVTPILLSYVDKYVKDFRPADAQVSLWGGGVALHNLVLKTDVVQQEVPLPFTLVSGRIHELLIQVPWTKIMSEPIIVTIDTIECILNPRPPTEQPKTETPSDGTQVVEAPPGYMQALVRRIVSNIAIKIHHLIVKYVQDDIVLSLNVKHLSINSTGLNWEPAFADIDPAKPAIRRLVVLDDLTLCLDRTDPDGKIRFYQDPLLYRCGLEFRVLAKLISANTRRASSFDVQMRTTKLAWGVTNVQLILLLRLLKEQVPVENKTPSPTSAPNSSSSVTSLTNNALKSPLSTTATVSPSTTTPVKSHISATTASAEVPRRESWSDWAWSWKSTNRVNEKEEPTMAPCPTPFSFSAYLDEVALIIKILGTEGSSRARSRAVLELCAGFAAVKCSICAPTTLRANVGIRSFVLKSNGKCVCGHQDLNALCNEPTIYLSSKQEHEGSWAWPDDVGDDDDVEIAEAAEEDTKKNLPKKEENLKNNVFEDFEIELEPSNEEPGPQVVEERGVDHATSDTRVSDETIVHPRKQVSIDPFLTDLAATPRQDPRDVLDARFWKKMSPLAFVEFMHDRSPPDPFTNPYEKPPKDFEYSDWEEECDIRVRVKPMDFRICTGLVHRLTFIKDIFADVPPTPTEPMRVLTIEEIEALNQNIPLRRIFIEIVDFRINIHPWDHSLVERPTVAPVLLRIEMPKGHLVVTSPLYAQRVCSAAGQLPEDKGMLWRACRMHTSVALNDIKISVCSPNDEQSKPCGRIDLQFVTHKLLFPEYFAQKQSIVFSYAMKISEANVCGSSARLHAAIQVLMSLMNERPSGTLRRTSLASDALADEDLVALDVTAEEFISRGFTTNRTNTHIVTLQSLRATVFQSTPGKELQQAWLFSGPDVSTGMPYVRFAFQWCKEDFPGSVDFLGLWTEATALAIDPLLISWLSYKPRSKCSDYNSHVSLHKTSSTTQSFLRRHTTPPSSSGRGLTRSGTASAEIHHKARSQDSSSEKSEQKETKATPPSASEPSKPDPPWWMGDNLLKIHGRLKNVLICVELGLALVYVTTKPATAVGCDTVRAAMEQHATNYEAVVVYGLGRWTLYTNTVSRHLWHNIQQDGPTYLFRDKDQGEIESFPWKMMLSDMSCYSLESPTERRATTMADVATGLRSRLKATGMAQTRSILELVSTNVVLSVVTKSLQHKIVFKKNETTNVKRLTELDKQQAKLRYFTAGMDFKPTTCLEFMRGPTKRKKDSATQSTPKEQKDESHGGVVPEQNMTTGPIVSLGFNMHADTPPLVFRMEYTQVHLISGSLHCITHIAELLKQNVDTMTHNYEIRESGSVRNLARSEVDEDVTTETASDDRLITIIYQRSHDNPIKTFVWFQWVISRITIVITVNKVKMAVDIDDVSLSLDLQEHYNQLKIKIASTSIKYFELADDSWVTGAFGGHVLAARESLKTADDVHFLAVTITSAQISNLPQNWKEELHPKLLEQQSMADKIWEVYAVLAPLKLVIVPDTLNNLLLIKNAITSCTSCYSHSIEERPQSTFSLPYCYLSAGGLKVVVASRVDNQENEDTFIFTVGKISVNPHPDNPICRQSALSTDSGWNSVSLEGRQYELTIRDITVETAEFMELAIEQENSELDNANENPAVKWSKTVIVPTLSPILHPLDIEILLAPALIIGDSLVYGAAIEINLTSDCRFEFNFNQIVLADSIYKATLNAARQRVPVPGERNKAECPYTTYLQYRSNESKEETGFHENPNVSATTVNDDDNAKEGAPTFSGTVDSGMETATSRSTYKSSPIKKESATSPSQRRARTSSDYLEIFIATGIIEVSLYTINDGSSEIQALYKFMNTSEEECKPKTEDNEMKKTPGEVAYLDFRRNQLINIKSSLAGKHPKCVPLLHAKFHQPNLYYWKRRSQKSLQVSLFNLWFGFGMGLMDNLWHSAILSTASGEPDPDTDIPPSLATMKYISGTSGDGSFLNQRPGTLDLDIERPVLIDASNHNLQRFILIYKRARNKLASLISVTQTSEPSQPMPYTIRQFLIDNSIDLATIQTSQIALNAVEATFGLDSSSLQVSMNNRRDQLSTRGLVKAFVISLDSNTRENPMPILHPMHIGLQMNAAWEAWQRAEGGTAAKQPSIRAVFDMDSIIVDLTPRNLVIVKNINKMLQDLKTITQDARTELTKEDIEAIHKLNLASETSFMESKVTSLDDHYYKDDLRSGAFQIVSGSQIPMAYQVTLNKNVITWRYPHPRAITKIVVYPLPYQDKETDGVLELYSHVLNRWEQYVVIKLPVGEPSEVVLNVNPPELIFATLWRFRSTTEIEKSAAYQFNLTNYEPSNGHIWLEDINQTEMNGAFEVTAEQLSGILRVDSYFGNRLTPSKKISIRFARMDLFLHNSVPRLPKNSSCLEGYFVSKPLMSSHRVLTISTLNSMLHYRCNSSAGSLVMFQTCISSEILDCSSSTMTHLADTFELQLAASLPEDLKDASRLRLCTTSIRLSLHLPKLRTLQALANDWNHAINENITLKSEPQQEMAAIKSEPKVVHVLEGRVSLWIRNCCSVSLRLGQEGTDEVFSLGPGAKFAYRWYNPTSNKRLRIARMSLSPECHWSNCVSFAVGENRVRLPDGEQTESAPGVGLFVHVSVRQKGAHRVMRLSGRLLLANMLKLNLLYKVRARVSESITWSTVASGELGDERVGRSVLSVSNSEMVLKIKLQNHETGWSGDIPLKECPKENVPWLVKVPSDGDVPYISVWCRVARARSDGRIIAVIWPLYVLTSNLTLDTDVLVVSELSAGQTPNPPPLIQSAPGRGTRTHLLAPGTTSAKHSLSFQYRNLECPVTREAVPLHYGVTDTSVFDKRVPVNSVDEVVGEIKEWLRSVQKADSHWPNSIVSKHWREQWQPALLQPRCDVTVKYRAIRAGGGGCSLEVQISPVLLMCNASTVAVTLRAHDAAPLCKLEPGNIISPPTIVLKKPFFISLEKGRETFVSEQLEVCQTDPGRYGSPPPGQLAVDHPADFAIHCRDKVTLLNMHFEIKDEISMIGITSAFVLVNNLDMEMWIDATAVPDMTPDKNIVLKPKHFKRYLPSKSPNSVVYIPLCELHLSTRWRGGDMSELSPYLSLALHDPARRHEDRRPFVPVKLGAPPFRRPVAFPDTANNEAVAIVVTQHKHEGRWIVTLSPDPCPQFHVQNNTSHIVAIGQPHPSPEDATDSIVRVKQECVGLHWWNWLSPGATMRYSSPAYTFGQSLPSEKPPPIQWLTFAHYRDDNPLAWCGPVAATAGEQLVLLSGAVIAKLRVRPHPHSTLVELRDVTHTDISAKEIRKRLLLSDSVPIDVGEGSTPLKLEQEFQESRSPGKFDQLNKYKERETIMRQIDITQLEKELCKLKHRTCEPGTRAEVEQYSSPLGTTKKETLMVATSTNEVANDTEMESENNNIFENDITSRPPQNQPTKERKIKFRAHTDIGNATPQNKFIAIDDDTTSSLLLENPCAEWEENVQEEVDRVRCTVASVILEMAIDYDVRPLLALHVDRAHIIVSTQKNKMNTTITVADIQTDNLQYETGQFDFAVIATTCAERSEPDAWPSIWNMFMEQSTFSSRLDNSRVVVKLSQDSWKVLSNQYSELAEVDFRAGPLALYIEDAYVTALANLLKVLLPPGRVDENTIVMADARTLLKPLRLRLLHIQPVDVTLTLHTAVRMYIALDQSPLHLNAFKVENMFTTTECLSHALTVHYFSAAILSAGWVVGGLELLGAPGALAARVGGATGGVRGVASTTAAALLRSLSACAGSLARNLDLLAGDEEHARRAAAARRRPPPTFLGGLVAGFTNFAINILGAVGGLAHHPVVGVAVGETASGAAALRRGLLGALTKPLSATADLLAFAGQGLLTQTGWDPVPQPRPPRAQLEDACRGWQRDCVRWAFRLSELGALAGFEVLLDDAPLQLIVTHKHLVFAEPECERIVEMIELQYCTLGPFVGAVIEICVSKKPNTSSKLEKITVKDEGEFHISEAAMQRVARYTGTGGAVAGGGGAGAGAGAAGDERALALLPAAGHAHALHALLLALTHANHLDTHFPLI